VSRRFRTRHSSRPASRRRQGRTSSRRAIHRGSRRSRYRCDALAVSVWSGTPATYQRGNVHLGGRDDTRLSCLFRRRILVPCRLRYAQPATLDPVRRGRRCFPPSPREHRVSLLARAALVPIQKIVNHGRQLIAAGRRYHRPQCARRASKISHETGWHNDDRSFAAPDTADPE
jgi:hypothetical protein